MNGKRAFLLIVLLLLLICTSCASFTSPARKHKLDNGESYWVDYDATRRGAIVTPQDKKLFVCSEPSPDVALEMVDKFLLKIGYEKISAEAQADISTKVVELGRRTQVIMFLRESLYRLCEMSANFGLKPDEVKDLYEMVISAAVDMAKAELIAAKAEEARQQAEKLRMLNKVKEDNRKYLDKMFGIE